eukprot:6019969-Amphidinium_carterae.1
MNFQNDESLKQVRDLSPVKANYVDVLDPDNEEVKSVFEIQGTGRATGGRSRTTFQTQLQRKPKLQRPSAGSSEQVNTRKTSLDDVQP